MSNANCSISTVFQNQAIPAGTSFSYSLTNGNLEDYYAFSVNSSEPTFLTITNGWYGNGDYQGLQCTVTNTGAATTFNLVLLVVSNTQADASSLNVKKVG